MRPVPGLVVALSLVMALVACGDTHVDESPNTAPPSSAPPSTASTEPEPLPNVSPTGTWTALDTHCGVLSAEVDGKLWIADPPLGDHRPPPGWDPDETWGHFIRAAKGRAMFRGEDGQIALFRAAAPKEDDPADGCE